MPLGLEQGKWSSGEHF